MLEGALKELRLAFHARPKPENWVADNLHPLDFEHGTDFVTDMKAGKDLALLFQGAIPYFACLTDEARVFLLPDYLGTIVEYDTHIIPAIVDFEGERGEALLASLTSAEQSALLQFIEALSQLDVMKFYSEEIRKLTSLVEASRTSRCTE